MPNYFITALCVALSHVACTQTYPLIGARSNGTGYASASLSDEWSVFNNPGGLAAIDQTALAITYDAVPGFSIFNRSAFAFALPTKVGGVSAGIFRFGDDLYNEQVIAAGYANKFGIASLGVCVKYIQYYAEGFGNKGVPAFSVGGITDLTQWLKIGAYIINVTQPNVTEDEKIATILILGIRIKASDKVSILAEIEKNIHEIPLMKAGLEYRIHPKMFLRTGFHVRPSAGFFGLGFHPKKIHFDYAYSYLPETSGRHQVGFTYILRKRK